MKVTQPTEQEKALAFVKLEITLLEESIRGHEQDMENLRAMAARRKRRVERLREHQAELEMLTPGEMNPDWEGDRQ